MTLGTSTGGCVKSTEEACQKRRAFFRSHLKDGFKLLEANRGFFVIRVTEVVWELTQPGRCRISIALVRYWSASRCCVRKRRSTSKVNLLVSFGHCSKLSRVTEHTFERFLSVASKQYKMFGTMSWVSTLRGEKINYKSVAKEVSKPLFFWLLKFSGHQSLPCLFDSRFL